MSIPADFRRVLEAGDPEWNPGQFPRLKLLYGDHLKNHLQVYTMSEFMVIDDQIKALPRGSKAKDRLSRYVLGQSITLDVDKDGRTVMPIRQREKLGLTDGELYFSGLGDHFEIWKAETYTTEVADEMKAWLEEQDDDFDILSLLDG